MLVPLTAEPFGEERRMLGAFDQGTDAQLLTHHLVILLAPLSGSKSSYFRLVSMNV